jgi:cell division protein FtsN
VLEAKDKSKLVLFNKKEITLILVFVIVVAITSFTLGVKIGKKYSFQQHGYTASDQHLINRPKAMDLQSATEEKVHKVINKESETPSTETKQKAIINDTYEKLKKEFSKLDEEQTSAPKANVNKKRVETKIAEPPADQNILDIVKKSKDTLIEENRDQYVGKYTIQLGSHQNLEEAEKFADGFKVRGYNPIINEVDIKNRGIWYRVSLGVFSTVSEAKKYIKQEDSLFQGQEYVIGKFQ